MPRIYEDKFGYGFDPWVATVWGKANKWHRRRSDLNNVSVIHLKRV